MGYIVIIFITIIFKNYILFQEETLEKNHYSFKVNVEKWSLVMIIKSNVFQPNLKIPYRWHSYSLITCDHTMNRMRPYGKNKWVIDCQL